MSEYVCTAVKMVVWDLDDTLWDGTLSEGTVKICEKRIGFVRYLNQKGIVNSICSKNDEKEVLSFLEQKSIRDLFVFPSIDWTPKGDRVKNLISNAGLRQANVVFVDDNPMNLEEVKYYCPEIMTLDVRDFDEFYNKMYALNLQDHASRIEQYRILERKINDRQNESDNVEFLRSCNIRIDIQKNCKNEIDRIYELIGRTNQLNFTKKRISKEELVTIIDDPAYDTGYVVVNDKYGEYGIAGFFAVNNGRLIHYLFSCRTMNMGIEQYVYRYLNCPAIDVVEPVSSKIDEYDHIDWITVSHINENERTKNNSGNSYLFKGPCDIIQASAYIDSKNITEEVTYINKRNGASVFLFNHSEFIRQIDRLSKEEKEQIVKDIPFVDEQSFETSIFSTKYDAVVYSLMVDYSLGIYRKKDGSYKIPLFQFTLPITDGSLLSGYRKGEYYFQNLKFDEEFYSWFVDNFEFEGMITKERLLENILYLRKHIDKGTKLILINGSEIPHDNPQPWMEGREKIHKEYNQFLKKQLSGVPGIVFLDMTGIIQSSADYSDSITHYKKKVYYRMAEEIASLMGNESNMHTKHGWKLMLKSMKDIAIKIINSVKVI